MRKIHGFLRTCSVLLLIAVCSISSGCSLLPARYTLKSYEPVNVYRKNAALPTGIQRVAVLPLMSSETTSWADAGVNALRTEVPAQLNRAQRFETIVVTPEQLFQWTGRAAWRADEELPADFFQRLRAGTGSDAVLFCQLTSYQPYPPLEIGWKFSLVGNIEPRVPAAEGAAAFVVKESSGILWSADEIFNAGMAEVAHGARAYSDHFLDNRAPLADSSSILSSPTQFGQYTLHTLFETLPAR